MVTERWLLSGRSSERRTVLAAVVLLASALFQTPAVAQPPEQTQQGAQEFITKVLTQGGITLERRDAGMPDFNMFEAKIELCRWQGQNVGCGGSRIERRHFPAFAVHSVWKGEGERICWTMVSHWGVGGNPWQEGLNIGSWYNIPKLTAPELHWDKIAEVKVAGTSVYVTGMEPALKFNLPSEALAARLGYAMEFLRASCDRLGETGF